MDASIIDKIKLEEKRTVKRMFYYTSIPILITIALVFISYIAVNNANTTVEKLKIDIADLNQKITCLNDELKVKSDSLKKLQEIYVFAINYKDKRFQLDYSIDKELFSRYPEEMGILEEIRELLNSNQVKWKLGGSSIEDGFDSPSFAAYLVNKHSRTIIPKNEIYNLENYLQIKDRPEIGDLVIFDLGFRMIYFEYRGIPFCVGMTPIGPASLKLDFGPRIIGYRNINY